MQFEQEKEKYIEKLSSIVKGIDSISKLRVDDLPNVKSKDLDEYKQSAQRLLKKLQENEFEIAVVGLEKAGKSSFSNAFIDIDVLPTDDQRCTYTSTRIQYGKDSKARISFYKIKKFNDGFREKLEKLKIANYETYTYDNLDMETYKRLFDETPDDIKKLYEKNLNEDVLNILKNKSSISKYLGKEDVVFSGSELESDEFKNYIINPGIAVTVREVAIESNKLESFVQEDGLGVGNAIMYDVPGFNSPTEMHKEQTIEKMKQVDAIIMVAKADEPSITGEVFKVFDNYEDDGTSFKEKLFIFANKADRAIDLNKNKAVTYEEWIDRRGILPGKYKDRIIFGSANAHLGDKVPNGKKAREEMDSKGLSYGIEDIRARLKEYYRNDRFDVLKKRVDAILAKIEEMFAEVKNSVNVSDYTGYKDIIALALGSYSSLSETIKKGLLTLKYEINESESREELSDNLRKEAKELITVERYTIDDEFLYKVHRDKAGNGTAEQPGAVEPQIRSERFSSMYSDFGNAIYSIAGDKYKEVQGKIEDIFSDALGLSKNSQNYKEVLESIQAFIEREDISNKEYFQSLIDRFSRDLYEILILKSRGQDRYNKFRERKENYLSMGVFYSASIAKESGDEFAYLSTLPQDSAMWKLLLWPETIKLGNIKKTLWAEIIEKTGIKGKNKSIDELLDKFIILNQDNSATLISDILKTLAKSIPEYELVSSVINLLQRNIGSDTVCNYIVNNYNLENIIKNKDCTIKREFSKNSKKTETTYEDIRKEFDADIEALCEVIIHSFIPAINIDRAFSAKAVNKIENVMEKISSAEFRGFLEDNLLKMSSANDKKNEIDAKRERAEVDRKLLENIEEILKQIKG